MEKDLKNIAKRKYKYLDNNLIKIIVEELLKINPLKIDNSSEIELVNLNSTKEYLYISLLSQSSLNIELTLNRNTIDMYIGEEKEPLYEMYDITDDLKFKDTLSKWFENKIIQKKVGKGIDVVYNCFLTEGNEILLKSINISYYFMWRRRYQYKTFKAWID